MIRVVVPYTKEVLDSVVYEYQEFFWPFQFIFVLLSLWIVYSIWKNENKNDRIIIGILAFFWFWTGAIYEMKYYVQINWFGLYIGSFFIFQGLLLLWFGIFKKKIEFVKNRFALLLSLFLILGYPLLEAFNKVYHFELSIIGMLPNITVIFLMVILFMNIKERILSLFIIPIVWSIFSIYWNYLILFK